VPQRSKRFREIQILGVTTNAGEPAMPEESFKISTDSFYASPSLRTTLDRCGLADKSADYRHRRRQGIIEVRQHSDWVLARLYLNGNAFLPEPGSGDEVIDVSNAIHRRYYKLLEPVLCMPATQRDVVVYGGEAGSTASIRSPTTRGGPWPHDVNLIKEF